MQFREKLLSVAVVLLLSGCGGGGGGGSAAFVPASTATPNNANNSSSTSTGNTNTNVRQGAVSGHLRVDNRVVSVDNATSFNTLRYNGKELPLTLTGISSGNMISVSGRVSAPGVSYQGFHVSGSKYSQARFGILGYEGKQIAFAQGNTATSTPTSGLVLYTGDALHQHKADNRVYVGHFTSTVDFATKDARINITHRGNPDVVPTLAFEGKLNGTTMELPSAPGNRHRGTAQAAFYGANAEAMAGTYEIETARGAFGSDKREVITR